MSLPLSCGGIAVLGANETRSGGSYVRTDAADFTSCQLICCNDPLCRGWVFDSGAPPCALLAAPGDAYPAAGIVSGAFLKPSVSPDAPQYTFETAFLIAALLLVGSFIAAVRYLRRDAGGDGSARRRGCGAGLGGICRTIAKRREYRRLALEKRRGLVKAISMREAQARASGGGNDGASPATTVDTAATPSEGLEAGLQWR